MKRNLFSTLFLVMLTMSAWSQISLNKTATTSSNESATYSGSMAFDGIATTRWSSTLSDPQWIYVDLGSTISQIYKVVLKWEAAYGKNFVIQTSNSSTGPWTDIYTATNNTLTTNTISGLNASGRFIRMYGTARGTVYGYSLWEFEVYNDNIAPTTPSALSSSNISQTGCTLSWAASTDNVGVSKYHVYKNGTWIGETTSTSYAVTGLSAGTAYTFGVQAQDAVVNYSGTATLNVTTSANVSNVALNKTTSSSSSQTSNQSSNAVDASTTTRWAANTGNANEWLQVDLGANYNLTKSEIMWENTTWIYKYKMEVSANGSVWTTVADKTANTISAALLTDNFTANNVRYIKVTNTGWGNGGYWASIFDWKVYGTPVPTIAVTGVSVSPTSATINKGATQQLTATVSPTNATNKTVTWSSSNSGVATVSASGLVTGVDAGSATITATTQDGLKTATSVITGTNILSTPLGMGWIGGNLSRSDNSYWKDKQLKDGINWATAFANNTDIWLPEFITDTKIFKTNRLLCWWKINYSRITSWADRTLPTADHYLVGGNEDNSGNGMAYEWSIRFCNKQNQNMWINIPHQVVTSNDQWGLSNQFVHKMAILLKHGVDMKNVDLWTMANGATSLSFLNTKTKQDFINAGGVASGEPLNSNLNILIEYSNECQGSWWTNRSTNESQMIYCNNMATALGFTGVAEVKRILFATWASVRCWQAFKDVFGADSRIKNLVGNTTFDSPELQSWQTRQFTEIINNSYHNTWNIKPSYYFSNAYFGFDRSGRLSDNVTFNNNVFNELTSDLAGWYNGASKMKTYIKNNFGLDLIMYEGGWHIVKYTADVSPDSRVYTLYQDWATKAAAIFTDYYCVLGGAGSCSDYCWDLKTSYWGDDMNNNNCHRYRAMFDWINAQPKSAKIATNILELDNSSIIVYPNPIENSRINVLLNGFATDEYADISIFDLSGKTIHQSRELINSSELHLNIDNLTKGMWLLSIQTKTNKGITKLIVQ